MSRFQGTQPITRLMATEFSRRNRSNDVQGGSLDDGVFVGFSVLVVR